MAADLVDDERDVAAGFAGLGLILLALAEWWSLCWQSPAAGAGADPDRHIFVGAYTDRRSF